MLKLAKGAAVMTCCFPLVIIAEGNGFGLYSSEEVY